MKVRIVLLLIWFYVPVLGARPAHGQAGSTERNTASRGAGSEREVSAAGELQPVAIPEPSALAMRFYRSGNWLWVLNRVWAILLPGTLVFSTVSARLRTLARRIGRSWFLSTGL